MEVGGAPVAAPLGTRYCTLKPESEAFVASCSRIIARARFLRETEVDADLDAALVAVAVGEALVAHALEVPRLVPEDGERAGRLRERRRAVLEPRAGRACCRSTASGRRGSPPTKARPSASWTKPTYWPLVSQPTCAGWPATSEASRERAASVRARPSAPTASQPCGREA